MGCCNCREIDIEGKNNMAIIESSRAEKLEQKCIIPIKIVNLMKETYDLKLECGKQSLMDKQSTHMNSESEGLINLKLVKFLKFDKSISYSNNNFNFNLNKIDSSNILQDTHKYMPKSFIETAPNDKVFNEKVILNNDISSSFISGPVNLKYRNNIHNNYFASLKLQNKQTCVPEMNSKAEESDNLTLTLKEIINYNLTQNTTVLNSIDYDNKNSKEILSPFNTRVLVKHSLRRAKSPKLLLPYTKEFTKNEQEIDLKSKNLNKENYKETISRYKHLFGDIEDQKAESLRAIKRCNEKRLIYLEDSDFTNLHKYGTIYSTNKTNSSNICTEDAKKTINSITRRISKKNNE